MSRRIGPSFAAELAAAGIDKPRAAWTEQEIRFLPDCPPAQRAAINAVLAAHDPEATVEREPPLMERIAALEAQVESLAASIATLPGGPRS